MKLIKMSLSKHGQFYAKVDDKNYDALVHYTWCIQKKGDKIYACASILGKRTFMHRFIMNVTDVNILVDHKDHDGLNNQEENLRKVNRAQNGANSRSSKNSSSKYKGVSWRKDSNRWSAAIRVAGESKYLGLFDNEEDAARAYDKKALEVFGEYASLNFKPIEQASAIQEEQQKCSICENRCNAVKEYSSILYCENDACTGKVQQQMALDDLKY